MALFADKQRIYNNTRVRLQAIREGELLLYTDNCRHIGTVSAVIAGLGFFGLVRCIRPCTNTSRQQRTRPTVAQLYTKMDYYLTAPMPVQLAYVLGCVVRLDPRPPLCTRAPASRPVRVDDDDSRDPARLRHHRHSNARAGPGAARAGRLDAQ